MVRLFYGGICLLAVLGLAACGASASDPEGTIEALNATIDHQRQEILTLVSVENEQDQVQPTATPRPVPSPRLTLPIATSRPVTTIQRPPTATASPRPSSTPTITPTPTPLPDASVGELATNLRNGPSVGFAIVAEVEAGSPLTVLAKSADGEWIKVVTPAGQEGWMYYLPLQVFIDLNTVPVE